MLYIHYDYIFIKIRSFIEYHFFIRVSILCKILFEKNRK
jgi:hypothetical protein